MKKRAIDCLYGAIIGDCLGSRYEFRNYNWFNDYRNHELQIPIGTMSDDSEMMMALSSAILEFQLIKKGYLATNLYRDQESIAKHYHDWYMSGPPDIGFTTRNAVCKDNSKDQIEAAKTFRVATKTGAQMSMSNGCLMRISPMAVYLAFRLKWDDPDVYCEVRKDTELTHCSDEAIDLTVLYVRMLMCAIQEGTVCSLALKHPLFQPQKTTYFHEDSNGAKYCSGDMRIAFQMCAKYHNYSYYDAMIAIMTEGGDTDTNACIVGAFLGALGKEVPGKWINEFFIQDYSKRIEKFPDLKLSKNIAELVNKLADHNK